MRAFSFFALQGAIPVAGDVCISCLFWWTTTTPQHNTTQHNTILTSCFATGIITSGVTLVQAAKDAELLNEAALAGKPLDPKLVSNVVFAMVCRFSFVSRCCGD
jgi:hypothetical protein